MADSPDAAIINAMTVDVEDYFQVSVFDGVVPRPAWDGLDSRVCANTTRLLRIFEATGVRPAFMPRREAAGVKLPNNLFGHRKLGG